MRSIAERIRTVRTKAAERRRARRDSALERVRLRNEALELRRKGPGPKGGAAGAPDRTAVAVAWGRCYVARLCDGVATNRRATTTRRNPIWPGRRCTVGGGRTSPPPTQAGVPSEGRS